MYMTVGLIVGCLSVALAIYALRSRHVLAGDEFAIISQGTNRRISCGKKSVFAFKPFQSIKTFPSLREQVLLTANTKSSESELTTPIKIEVSGCLSVGTEVDSAIQYAIRLGSEGAKTKTDMLREVVERLMLMMERWSRDCEPIDQTSTVEMPEDLDSLLRTTSNQFGLQWHTKNISILDKKEQHDAALEKKPSLTELLHHLTSHHQTQMELAKGENSEELRRRAADHEVQKTRVIQASDAEVLTEDIQRLTNQVEMDAIRSKSEIEKSAPDNQQLKDAFDRNKLKREQAQRSQEEKLRQDMIETQDSDQ
ncbi:hypothetical protein N9239_00480 [bacterium]|nr:hypothetical protein [bacterium]